MEGLRIVVCMQSLLLIAHAWSLAIPGEQNEGSRSCKTLAKIQEKNGLIGSFIPRCKKNGYYQALQCHGSTGICWCVNKFGEALTGEAKKSSKECNNPCFRSILDNPPPSILIQGAPRPLTMDVASPICDEQGFYAAKQCKNEKEFWCVDKMGNHVNSIDPVTNKLLC